MAALSPRLFIKMSGGCSLNMKSPGVPRTLLNLAGRLVLVLALLGTASLVAVPVFADSVVTPGALQVTQISGGPAVVRQPIT